MLQISHPQAKTITFLSAGLDSHSADGGNGGSLQIIVNENVTHLFYSLPPSAYYSYSLCPRDIFTHESFLLSLHKVK